MVGQGDAVETLTLLQPTHTVYATTPSWYIQHWTPPAVPRPLPEPLIAFAYKHLKTYSGLDMGRVRPQDRLVEDLQFPLVCWFDWGPTLCEDFFQQFGIDITDTFDETQFATVADLIRYLEQELQVADC